MAQLLLCCALGYRIVGGQAVKMRQRDPFEGTPKEDTQLQEARLRDFASIASDWYFELDADLRVTYLSDNWSSFFSFEREDYLGLRLDDLWRRLRVPEPLIAENLAKFERYDPEISFDRRHRLPSGKLISMRLKARIFENGAGAFAGYRGVGVDVSDEHNREADLMRAKTDAQLANHAKTNFLANMSHELRTPLNSILGFSQVIHQQVFGPIGSDRYQSYVSDINRSAAHLLEIIDDILDFARIGAGEDPLEESIFSVQELVASCIRRFEEHSTSASVTLSTYCDESLPLLKADRIHLRRILQNLLSNAIKFSDQGGTILVSCRISKTGDLEISVQDNGIGISETDFEKILEPFEQVAPALSRGHEGTGLGLPVAKTLIDLHGGVLTVSSKPGHFTCFCCILPASRLVYGSTQESLNEEESQKVHSLAV